MTTSLALENAQFITLKNGLKVMLCPQPDGEASYVSMAVRAGHFYDPDNCHGLAHLLEHMLFMGSRHLPAPNAINGLMEKHGGSLNAWTGTEYANYHFHCHQDALPAVLPMFADMLRRPLLNKQAIDSEIQSIDAEFQFKRKDDLRRLYQVHKETCNPQHPFSKFSVGTAALFRQHSLDELHSMLQRYHRQYYCAANMTLCIITPQPVEEVLPVVERAFSPLPEGQLAVNDWPDLYTQDQLGIEINIRPLQEARRMIVTFAMPGLHNNYHTKPLNYISHLLGDEGEGSLLAALKARNWVTNLIAGSGIEGDDFKDFNVSFQLTKAGLAHKNAILQALFDCLALVKDSVGAAWRFQEKARLTALAQQYDESARPLSVACEYAHHLFLYAPEEIVQLHCTIDSYDEAVLQHALSYFVPERLRVKLIAPEVATDTQCAYYDAEYSVTALPAALLDDLARPRPVDAISLPGPNPYLADDYHLVLPEEGKATPHAVADEPGMCIWYAQDHQFHSPKGDIYVSFEIPAFADPLAAVAAKRIWIGALNDHLQAQYYRAEIAGLHYRIYGHQAGLTLHTRGFTNQQMLLAEQLIDAIMSFRLSERAFEHSKQMQQQALQNSLLNKPTNRLFSRLSVLIQRNTQAPAELLSAINACTFADVVALRDAAFSEYFIEGFIHGNWGSEQARELTELVRKRCPNATGKAISRAVSRLPVGRTLYHQVPSEHNDAAVVLYLQSPSASLSDSAMCMVLEQMLAAPFFNALRTEQQLGYVVGTGYVPHNQHPGIAFYVQSPTHGPQQLLSAMTGFLYQQLKEIDFYRYYWPTIKQNLLKQLDERDMSLAMKSQRLWVSLGTKDLEFNRNTRLAECITDITFEAIQDFAARLADRTLCGELVLYANGKFSELATPGEDTVTDIAEFKRSSPYFH